LSSLRISSRNPGLAATSWSSDQHIFEFQSGESFELKWIGFEWSGGWCADSFNNRFTSRVCEGDS
jgi:hypothetical protein